MKEKWCGSESTAGKKYKNGDGNLQNFSWDGPTERNGGATTLKK